MGRAGAGHRWEAWGGEREWGETRWGGGGGGNGAGRDGAGWGGVGQGVSGWGGMRWDEGEMGRSGGGHTVLRDVRCCAAASAPRRATSALAGGVDMGWDGMGRDGARGGARWQG